MIICDANHPIDIRLQAAIISVERIADVASEFSAQKVKIAEKTLSECREILKTVSTRAANRLIGLVGLLGLDFESISVLQHSALLPINKIYRSICRWNPTKAAAFRSAYFNTAQLYYYRAYQRLISQYPWNRLVPASPTPLIGDLAYDQISDMVNNNFVNPFSTVRQNEVTHFEAKFDFINALVSMASGVAELARCECDFASQFLQISPTDMAPYIQDTFGRPVASFSRHLQDRLLLAANISEVSLLYARLNGIFETNSLHADSQKSKKKLETNDLNEDTCSLNTKEDCTKTCDFTDDLRKLLEPTLQRLFKARLEILIGHQQKSAEGRKIDKEKITSIGLPANLTKNYVHLINAYLSLSFLDITMMAESSSMEYLHQSVQVHVVKLSKRLAANQAPIFIINNYSYILQKLSADSEDSENKNNMSLFSKLKKTLESKIADNIDMLISQEIHPRLPYLFLKDGKLFSEMKRHELEHAGEEISRSLPDVVNELHKRLIANNSIFISISTRQEVLEALASAISVAYAKFYMIYDELLGKISATSLIGEPEAQLSILSTEEVDSLLQLLKYR